MSDPSNLLSQVNDLTLKSFNSYSGPSDKTFSRCNTFFAPNGSGKTSFANGIKSEYLKSHAVNSMRFYSSDFIKSQLLLEDSDSNIKGVKANFGDKDIDIELRLKKKEEELSETEKEIDKSLREKSELNDNTIRIVDEIFLRLKGQASISRKPLKDKDDIHTKVIGLWNDDLTNAERLFKGQDFSAVDGGADFSSAHDALNSLSFACSDNISKEILEDIRTLLGEPFKQVDIPESEIVDWLEVGLKIHDGKDRCEFCNASLDWEAVQSKIGSYLSDKLNIGKRQLAAHSKHLLEIKDDYMRILDNRDGILLAFEKDPAVVKNIDDLSTEVNVFNDLADVIARKLSDMSTSVFILPEDILNNVEKCRKNLAEMETLRKAKASELLDKINRREALVKGAIGYEVSNNGLVTNNLSKFEGTVKRLTGLVKSQETIRVDIRRLQDSKSDLSDFAGYLNEIFGDIGLDLRLELEQDSYIILHRIHKTNLTMEDISEGERNLLALTYFFYEMLNNDKKTLKPEIELVIIDDPTSSMDDENKFYILELVKGIMGDIRIQSFIFTHSWNDYSNLCYGKHSNPAFNFYEIVKLNGHSKVVEAKNLNTPYKQLFKEIYDVSEKSFADLSDDELLHLPNTIRRVLEEYLRFNFGIDMATQTHVDDIATCLYAVASPSEISKAQMVKLNMLLAVCNIFSHGTPRERSSREIYNSARYFMQRIEDANKHHHTKMKI